MPLEPHGPIFVEDLEEALRKLELGGRRFRSSALLNLISAVRKALERGDANAAAFAMFNATYLYQALMHGPMAVNQVRATAQRRRAAPLGGRATSTNAAKTTLKLIEIATGYQDAHPGTNTREVARWLAEQPGITLQERTLYNKIRPHLHGQRPKGGGT